MSRFSEQLLVLRCQAGDMEAFRRLYDRFAERSLRYLRGLLGSDAEDVHQEVWLAVYRRIGGLANPAGFRTWLFATTRNRALDHLRRSGREKELFSTREPVATDVTAQDEEPDIDSEAIARAMESLRPIHREVLILRYWDDLSYAQIALVIGCSMGTVRSRIHNARNQVQLALQDHHTHYSEGEES